MPVYLITLHAYRSWTEENPKGYFRRGERGIKPPDVGLARQRAASAKQAPARFDPSDQTFLIEHAREVVSTRHIRLHAVSCTPTHLHLVASWFGGEVCFKGIAEIHQQARLLASTTKRVLGTLMSKRQGSIGHRWFSRGSDCTPVNDHEHLNHLLTAYLPKHREEDGTVQIFDRGHTNP